MSHPRFNTRIGFFTFVNPDCSARGGDVTIRVVNQPEHGTTETSSLRDYPGYAKESLRYKCNQTKAQGTQIKYKSADKYTGKDALDVLVMFGEGLAWEVHFDLSVR